MRVNLNNPVPLYLQIVENLKAKIAAGDLNEGDYIGSQQDLAKEYGVSLITARKAMAVLINEGNLVGRVGKGMYVARRNRSLDKHKYRMIGLVLSNMRDPFFSLIMQSVELTASEKRYNLLLSNSSGRIEKEENQIQHFLEMGIDGLIIASMTHKYKATSSLRKLNKDNIPFVMVSYIEDPDIYYVGTNHEKGGYLAAEHLIKQGFDRIGYVSAERGSPVALRRQHGYAHALREYGKLVNPDDIFYMRWNDFNSGYEIATHILAQPNKPNAFFIFSDIAALGFEKAVLEHGLKIPADIALVGYDNIERASYAPVPLTTVHQPTFEIGVLAFEKLFALIEGRSVEVRTILEPKLIVRDSCKGQMGVS